MVGHFETSGRLVGQSQQIRRIRWIHDVHIQDIVRNMYAYFGQ
jgi:hypothetical protein